MRFGRYINQNGSTNTSTNPSTASPLSIPSVPPSVPTSDPAAWAIIKEYAGTEMTFTDAEARLQAYLGRQFHFADWKSAFDVVFEAEEDIPAAAAAIEKMATQAIGSSLAATSSSSRPPAAPAPSPNPSVAPFSQLQGLEVDLMRAVDDLQQRKRIRGTAPTLEDLLNPIEEIEIGHSDYRFPGGDDEIVAEALRATTDAPDEEMDDDEEEEIGDDGLSAKEGQGLCEQLEKLCLHYSNAEGVSTLVLQQQLHKLCAHLRRLEFTSQTQVTLDKFWSAPP